MQVRDYWKVSSLLLLSLLLSSCASWPGIKTVEVKTVEVERQIPVQNRPPQLRMNTDMKWWVVTEENFKEFKEIILEIKYDTNLDIYVRNNLKHISSRLSKNSKFVNSATINAFTYM